jgi:hypothetical protein
MFIDGFVNRYGEDPVLAHISSVAAVGTIIDEP